MGDYTSECPEKKPKDSCGGSRGGFAMMCFKTNESLVGGDSEQTSAHHTEQPNLEVHLEEKNSDVHLEAQLEQSLSLQDWLNSKPVAHD